MGRSSSILSAMPSFCSRNQVILRGGGERVRLGADAKLLSEYRGSWREAAYSMICGELSYSISPPYFQNDVFTYRLHFSAPSLLSPSTRQTTSTQLSSHYQPNKLPPPPPALPPLRASFTNHSRRNSSSRISSGFTSRVSNCASWRLNANSVGILAICPLLAFIPFHPHLFNHLPPPPPSLSPIPNLP
jgi:hypothetical protein